MAAPKLQHVVEVKDGKQITAGDKVIERVSAAWVDWDTAASSAGIDRATLHVWRKKGARIREALANDPTLECVGDDQAYLDFVTALEHAEDEAEIRRLALIQREAQGGYPIVKTTEKTDADGNVVERLTTTEYARPQWMAAAWQLERRRPSKYGKRVEVSGPDGDPIPIEVRKAAVKDSLSRFMEGAAEGADAVRAMNAVEVTSTEVE